MDKVETYQGERLLKKDDNEKYVETLEIEQLIEIILKLENHKKASATLVEISICNPDKIIANY